MFNIKSVFKKILFLLDRRQKIYALIMTAFTCINGVLECLGVSVIIPLISIIQSKDALKSNAFVQSIPFLANADYAFLVFLLCAAIIFIYIAKNAFFIFLSFFSTKFSNKIQRELSVKILKSYMCCGYQFFLRHNIGYFMRGIDFDTQNLNLVLTATFNIISDFLMCALICAFLVFTDWQMTLAILGAAILCVFLIYFVFRKNMRRVGKESLKFRTIVNQIQTQIVHGVKDVMILRKQDYFVERFRKNKITLQTTQVKQTIGNISPARIIEAIFVSVVISAIGIRSIAVENATEFVAKLAAFALGAFRMLPAIGRISGHINNITTYLPSVDSLCQTIKEAEQYTKDHPESNYEIPDAISQKIEFEKSLDFENITFRYSSDLESVVENVSLKIKKGTSVAFIGQSGSGKSTLVDILLGLLVPESGRILMDEKDIRLFPEKWSSIVGYIPQSVFLTDSSIRENIAFGVDAEKIDDELVEEVLKTTQLKEFIDSLPEKEKTLVGDRGVRLSGGQRQRIAIARALYHKPQIMVLDEATSALDNETESAIMHAINTLRGQMTLVIVAHRLSTVEKCDEIYEVNGKKLIKKTKREIFGEKYKDE